MLKIKQWFKKLNKFEKVFFILFAAVVGFFLFILLINIVIALGFAGIKLKAITWQTFSTAYAEDICFKISAIIGIIVVVVLAGFIGYQKWQQFDMFAYEQKKKKKKEKSKNLSKFRKIICLN